MKPVSTRQMKKQIIADFKSIIKHIKIEIERLNNDISDCIKTIDGFERFIAESIFLIKDRDNLVSSQILNRHNNRVLYLKTIIERLSRYVDYKIDISEMFNNAFIKSNGALTDSINTVNKSIEHDIESLLEFVPDYIQNINKKIISINEYRESLEELYKTAIEDFKFTKQNIRKWKKEKINLCNPISRIQNLLFVSTKQPLKIGKV
jgi:hypothetical protein